MAEPVCYVNGRRYVLPPARADQTLLSYLREIGLTGTKLGCGEGGCGACTVMLSSVEPDGSLYHRSVNACLCPLYSVEGMHVVTVEGIGNSRDGLHPVQERLANAHGSQCGFCTPGFVMSMYSLLRSKREAPTEEEIEENLAGNLCRCTGYRPIVDAFRAFAKSDPAAYTEEAIAASKAAGGADASSAASGKRPGGRVCPSTGQPCACGEADGGSGDLVSRSEHKEKGCGPLAPLAPTAEPIFPPELRTRVAASLELLGPRAAWHRPVDLAELLALKRAHPEAKLVVGNTEVGIEMKFKDAKYPVLVGATHVPELNAVAANDAGVTLGASVTLSRVMKTFRRLIASLPRHQTSTLRAVVEQLRWFAGPPIRNAAALGGNIATASPISDLNPLWMACGAVFTVVGEGTGERQIPAQDFFLGYRKVFVPFNERFEYVKEFKQAHRRDDDIAIVNAGVRLRLRPAPAGGWEIGQAWVAYGGVAPKTIMAPAVAAALGGRALDAAAVEAGLAAVAEDVKMSPDAPGGMVEFRRSLAASFLFKALVWAAQQLGGEAGAGFASPFPPEAASAAAPYAREPSRGLQYFSQVGSLACELWFSIAIHGFGLRRGEQEKRADGGRREAQGAQGEQEEADREWVPGESVVGQPYRHMAAAQQVTGEAQYVDDIKLPAGALHAAPIMSSKPHARLLSVDCAAARAMPGVVGVFTAADVQGSNHIGPVAHDEELFATEVVTCVGQFIGVVVADTEQQARCWGAAAAKRRGASGMGGGGSGSPLDPPDALTSLTDTNLKPRCPHEPPAPRAPRSDRRARAPCPRLPQARAAAKAVVVEYEELPAVLDIDDAIAAGRRAHAYGSILHLAFAWERPCTWERPEAMRRRTCVAACRAHVRSKWGRRGTQRRALTGRRAPPPPPAPECSYITSWSAPIGTKNGDAKGALEGGACEVVLEGEARMGGQEHFYLEPNASIVIPGENDEVLSYSSSQSPDHHQRDLSHVLGIPQHKIVSKTKRLGGGFGGKESRAAFINCAAAVPAVALRRPVRICLDRDEDMHITGTRHPFMARYKASACAVGFSHEGRLQALAATLYANAGNSLDLTHSIVQRSLLLLDNTYKVPLMDLEIIDRVAAAVGKSREEVANLNMYKPTDVTHYGQLLEGCQAQACWDKVMASSDFAARKAAADAYNGAHRYRKRGLAAVPTKFGISFTTKFLNQAGALLHLYRGAAVAEVELDTLTGDFQVLRADVCMDVGKSLNPAIDIGQVGGGVVRVEGAFVQGMGWSTIEELVWGDAKHTWVRPGTLHTRGPGTYKIPSVNDIPIDFRVTLLRNAPCARTPTVHSSKAVGEPPFFLGTSVFFALRAAVGAARADAGLPGWFRLDPPATPEKLRVACVDACTAAVGAPPDLVCKASC
eukprot:scaffold3.g6651.t1